MKLYLIRAWNDVGGGIGTYYVIAKGVNAAKMKIRETDKIAKKLEVVEVRHQVLFADDIVIK